MSKRIVLTIFLISCLAHVYAQQATISGVIADTTYKAQIKNASVIIIGSADSIIYGFTRTNSGGNFLLPIVNGNYTLIISHPKYVDYTERFTINSTTPNKDFGSIAIEQTAKILKDVVIKGRAIAVRLKGDTTEYDAKAFTIQPNAKVEDLLKQLPALQVDKNGNITAQGQRVPKVLLDGEEFFGDDPTLLTRNIRADMVDVVQLYDRKSDQATFTGLNDGETIKTINIKLKEDKSTGQFGKADFGLGSRDFLQGQALYNRFKNKMKFSAFLTGSNTGKTGLSMGDNQAYGDENFDENSSDNELDNFDGRYTGEGIPKAVNGGVHYDNKWQKNNQALNANYKVGSLDIDGNKASQVQYFLPTKQLYTNTNHNFNNHIFRQKLDAAYKVNVDSVSMLKINLNAIRKDIKTDNPYAVETYNSDGNLINTNRRNTDAKRQNDGYLLDALYTRRLNKRGRNFSLKVSEAINHGTGSGFLRSFTNYLTSSAAVDSTSNIDQLKTVKTVNNVFNSNLTFTEPISKILAVTFNYGYNVTHNNSENNSYEQSAPENYNILNPLFSNNYEFTQREHQLGTMFNSSLGKVTLTFGTHTMLNKYNQVNESNAETSTRSFTNWNPVLSMRYNISKQKTLRINYIGMTIQPTIDQIQPLISNLDPLNIFVGNPALKPSFRNRISINYNSYKVSSGQNLFISSSYYFLSNAIVENTQTTDVGQTIYQYSNLDTQKPHFFYLFVNFNRKISGPDFKVGLNGTINQYVSYNFSNGALNKTNNSIYQADVTLSKNVEKQYDFALSAGPSYNVNSSSLNKTNNSNSNGFNSKLSATYYLKQKLQFNTDVNYTYLGASPIFNNHLHNTLVNAAVSRTFFQRDNLKISLSVNDLFNQNNGFQRLVNGSTITQNTFTTIKRYIMLGIYWDFSKFGSKLEQL